MELFVVGLQPAEGVLVASARCLEQFGFRPVVGPVLTFKVDDIDQAVDALASRGVRFERYDNIEQDDRGVFREEGPYIAWFKDPSGNVLSVIRER
jgi:hypothetical protein